MITARGALPLTMKVCASAGSVEIAARPLTGWSRRSRE
jgi:hypothetical protein